MDIESQKTTAHFSYRIEQKPDGGFVARCSDAGMEEPIEGMTKDEVMRKIEEKVAARMGLSPELFQLDPGKHVVGNIKVTRTSAAPAAATETPPPSAGAGGDAVPSPISRSDDRSGRMLRILAALLAVGAVLYLLVRVLAK